MNAHISDDLPRLLTGDATRDIVLEAAAHLRTCADCQQELVSAVVAHASLTSAHRFAPDIVAPDTEAAEQHDPVPEGSLPDLSSMFAKVREEAVVPAARPKRRRVLIGVAAAAVVAAGGGVTIANLTSDSSAPSTRTVALSPYGVGHQSAKVTLVGTSRMKVDATSLPKLDAKHQYEIWLTDDRRVNMQSVGFIGNNRKADLTIPSKVMSQYNDIEVSVQKIDQVKYSGTSVLRGAYG